MARTTRCPTYSTISPRRVAVGSALVGIGAACTTSSRSRARGNRRAKARACTHKSALCKRSFDVRFVPKATEVLRCRELDGGCFLPEHSALGVDASQVRHVATLLSSSHTKAA